MASANEAVVNSRLYPKCPLTMLMFWFDHHPDYLTTLTVSDGTTYSNKYGLWGLQDGAGGAKHFSVEHPLLLARHIDFAPYGLWFTLTRFRFQTRPGPNDADVVGSVTVKLQDPTSNCNQYPSFESLVYAILDNGRSPSPAPVWQALTADPLPTSVTNAICAREMDLRVQPALNFALDVIVHDREGAAYDIKFARNEQKFLSFIQRKHGTAGCVLTESGPLVYYTEANLNDSSKNVVMEIDGFTGMSWYPKGSSISADLDLLMVPVDSIRRALSRCSTRLLAVSLTISLSITEGHATVLFFDQENKQVQLFDPNGFMSLAPKFRPQAMDEMLKAAVHTEFGLDYQGLGDIDGFCPSLQSMQGVEFEHLAGDPEGFCAAWSLFMIDFRLSNPTLSPKEAMWAAHGMLQKSPLSLTDFIRHYALYIINEGALDAPVEAGNASPEALKPPAQMKHWPQQQPPLFSSERPVPRPASRPMFLERPRDEWSTLPQQGSRPAGGWALPAGVARRRRSRCCPKPRLHGRCRTAEPSRRASCPRASRLAQSRCPSKTRSRR